MEISYKESLKKSMDGDIDAFQMLFSEFQSQLKSYLFRLTASREDSEDFFHDTFVKAFSSIKSFKGESSLKTWVFRIATNLVNDEFRKRKKRWPVDVKTLAKNQTLENPSQADRLKEISLESKFEINEHIDTCFTCMTKTLPPREEVVIILKEIYQFTVEDIGACLEISVGSVKHLLSKSRQTMIDLFHGKCALVSKKGACHQCSELSGWLNPEHQLAQLKMVEKKLNGNSKMEGFEKRLKIVRSTDPLNTPGREIQAALLDCNRKVMGEIS